MKDLIKGGIITLVIGGSVFTFSQADVVKNFAKDTGLTQEQAEQYVSEISEDQLISFEELGSDFIDAGQELRNIALEIDCVNYEYEWESSLLSCSQGKRQLDIIINNLILLGQAYIKLNSDSASEADIASAILLIDQLNSSYKFEIISNILDQNIIDEVIKTNFYNKAILKTALESK